MSVCPACRKVVPDGVTVCPHDGVPLNAQDHLAHAKTDVSGGLSESVRSVHASEATVLAIAQTDVSGADLLASSDQRDAGAASLAAAGAPVVSVAAGVGAVAVATKPVAMPAAAPAVASGPAPDQSMDPMVGARVAGRYEVIRRIGEGGMGAVYEARHTVIGKRVALKVLLEKFEAKSDFVARLLQEARLASSIGHMNIVDVTDFGMTDDGRSFVVMEFLDGESLAQLLSRDAPLPVERCLRICRQVASALSAAHVKGIVHRDVKPENVYLVQRGEADFVKVVDFGISKAVQPADNDADAQRLTHTGTLLGTPLYMSPEQARGQDTDHRADVWALGVLMYECLTGEVPFRANNYLGVIAQVLNHKPPLPSELRPELGIPPAVETVLMRAMNKDVEARYQQMSQLEHDLERLLAGDQNVGLTPRALTETPDPGTATRGRHRWAVVLGVAVLAVSGVSIGMLRGGGGAAVRQAPVAIPARSAATEEADVHASTPPSRELAPSSTATAPSSTAEIPATAHHDVRRGTRRVRTAAASRASSQGASAAPAPDGKAPIPELVRRGVLPVGSQEAYSKP